MRTGLIQHIVEESDGTLEVEDIGNGWPSRLVAVDSGGLRRPVDVYVSQVSGMARGDEDELRFQNPASNSPIRANSGATAMLLGYWAETSPPILVAADARSRAGRITRFSVRFPRSLVDEASAGAWASYVSTSDETIRAFHAGLASTAVLALGGDTWPDPREARIATSAAGLAAAPDSEQARERARRSVEVLVRDGSFGSKVRALYAHACAVCGLSGSRLVVGAHILPVEAPASVDSVRNGVSLCQNHHAAFDAHMWTIDPADQTIRWHPDRLAEAGADSALATLIGASQGQSVRHWPIDFSWADARISYYSDDYGWL